jgi:hypothetical protein
VLEGTYWEYRTQQIGSIWKQIKDDELQEMLNEWGEDGWEVFQVVSLVNNYKLLIVARRPLSASARRKLREFS